MLLLPMLPAQPCTACSGYPTAGQPKARSGECPLLLAGGARRQVRCHMAVVVHQLPAVHPWAADGCVKVPVLCAQR